jgi:AraC-like DNA-binding protein
MENKQALKVFVIEQGELVEMIRQALQELRSEWDVPRPLQLSRKQVAETLGCSVSYVHKLVRQGELIPIGRWITASSLENYVRRKEHPETFAGGAK